MKKYVPMFIALLLFTFTSIGNVKEILGQGGWHILPGNPLILTLSFILSGVSLVAFVYFMQKQRFQLAPIPVRRRR